MFETVEAVTDQIRAGEDSFAEFKEIRLGDRGGVRSPNAEDFAGELVALANAEGGAVFLGVRDDGSLQGIAADAFHAVEQWAVNVATNNCDPPLRPALRTMALTDSDGELRRILLVLAPRASFRTAPKVPAATR